MSLNDRPAAKGQTVAAMAFGTIIFLATTAAWLYGSEKGIDTTVLWTVTTPVIGALFIGGALSKTADHAEQAAIQTNGSMEAKIKSQVATALAERDSTRAYERTTQLAPPVRVDANVPAMEPDGADSLP